MVLGAGTAGLVTAAVFGTSLGVAPLLYVFVIRRWNQNVECEDRLPGENLLLVVGLLFVTIAPAWIVGWLMTITQ